MSSLITALALLALVAGAGTLSRVLPRVPRPLLQMALGAACGWPAAGLHVALDPQVFMLLFIPPMLFADGWQIPKRELGAQFALVLLLSVGLVLGTVLVVGHAIAWMVPSMPLSVAFLLAAVLSPTDAVAVSALVQHQRMPARLQHILEGESLMNDASALVAVKFAVLATLTQRFSLAGAAADFVWMAAGGVAVGAVCSLVLDRLQLWMLHGRESRVEMPGVLLFLLMPFPPYLLAEHWGLSGVLAAVAAGVTASLLAVRRSRFNASHVQSQATWGVLRYVFDGLVFLLLGLQLPRIVQALPEQLNLLDAPWSPRALALWGTGLAITALLLALRFAGFMVGSQLKRRVAWLRRRTSPEPVSPALAGAGAVGGIRGAITLAAVLGVPFTLPDGSAFPLRGLLVFLAALVIVLTLVVAALALPPLLRRVAAASHRAAGHGAGRERLWARRRASRAALRTIAAAALRAETTGFVPTRAPRSPSQPPDLASHAAACARIDHGYRHRLQRDGSDAQARSASQQMLELERHLRLQALQAERDELLRLRLRHRINDDTLRLLTHEIDLVEAVLRHDM